MKKMIKASEYPLLDNAVDRYLPSNGEGDTKASQVVTALNKLMYKWYNDGDVFDNHYGLEGFSNDLSSYANWLYGNIPGAKAVLEQIFFCTSDNRYERLLKDLLSVCADPEDLEKLNQQPKEGSIYDAEGPFSVDFEDERDYYDDSYDEYDYDDEDYDEYEEDW